VGLISLKVQKKKFWIFKLF